MMEIFVEGEEKGGGETKEKENRRRMDGVDGLRGRRRGVEE